MQILFCRAELTIDIGDGDAFTETNDKQRIRSRVVVDQLQHVHATLAK